MRKYIYVILLLFFVSCETDFDLDYDTSPVGIMTSFFVKGQDIEVNIYESSSYIDSLVSPTVEMATVTLCINGLEKEIKYLGTGYRTVTFDDPVLADGDTIEIVAETENGTLSAKTVMLEPVEILSLDTVRSGENLNFSLRMRDPQATKDYYQVQVLRQEVKADTLLRTAIECDYSDRIFIEAASDAIGNVLTSSGLFTDELISGMTYTLSFSIDCNELNINELENSEKSLLIYLFHHTYDFYAYLYTSASSEFMQRVPVFGPSGAYSNIDGGNGIVSAIAYDSKIINLAE